MYHTMYRILNWNISLNFFDICLFQDISDDILLGIKSTAIKFKEHTKYWLTGFSAIMTSGLTIGGIMVDRSDLALLFSCGIGRFTFSMAGNGAALKMYKKSTKYHS